MKRILSSNRGDRQMAMQMQEYSPRDQDDLFRKANRANASAKLKSLVLGSGPEEFFGLPAAAEAISLSQDTLRRAIKAGDLVVEVVAERGREVYQITKYDLFA